MAEGQSVDGAQKRLVRHVGGKTAYRVSADLVYRVPVVLEIDADSTIEAETLAMKELDARPITGADGDYVAPAVEIDYIEEIDD